MTEIRKVGVPGCFHAALLGPLTLELMFEVFVLVSLTHLISTEHLLKKACSCLARLLHNGLLFSFYL